MEAVAESLKEFDLDNTEADVPSSLRHGKKLLPLGRYLRGRLRVLLGKDKGAPKETLEKMVEELREMQRISWQSQETGTFIPVSEVRRRLQEQPLKNLEARQRVFKKRKTL